MEWVWTGAYLASEQKGGQGHKLTLLLKRDSKSLIQDVETWRGNKEKREECPSLKRAVVARSSE